MGGSEQDRFPHSYRTNTSEAMSLRAAANQPEYHTTRQTDQTEQFETLREGFAFND